MRKKYKKHIPHKWFKWYAWKPVMLNNGGIAWLETIERKVCQGKDMDRNIVWWFEYRRRK